MPFIERFTTFPPLSEIIKVPQIVIIDRTGPAVRIGTSPKSVVIVGEFLKGPFIPTRVGSSGQLDSLYDASVDNRLSQTVAGIQDGSGGAYNGNGSAMLKGKTYRRLSIQRVDMDAVTSDGGTTKGTISVTVTVNAADQDGSGNTNKDIVVKGGARFGDDVLASAINIVGLSQDETIPSGTALTAGAFTFTPEVFFIKTVNPTAAVAAANIDTVIDALIENVNAGTTVTAVVQAADLWVPGAGTNFEDRIANRYLTSINGTLPGDSTSTNEISVIYAARRASTIRVRLSSNAVAASQTRAVGRMCIVDADSPASTDAAGAAAGIVAAAALASTESIQNDRVIVTFPQTKVFIDDLNKNVLVSPSGWMSSILSNFAEEVNPGADPAPLLDQIVSLEDAYVFNPISKDDHAALIAGGVSALQKDRTLGWWFVDGITAVNPVTQPTRVTIQRRRMADLIQENLAVIAAPFLKQPATTERIDAFTAEVDTFLAGLLSEDNVTLQRIEGYLLDEKSANTPELRSQGIFIMRVAVRTLSQFRDIVFETTIGETVSLTAEAA